MAGFHAIVAVEPERCAVIAADRDIEAVSAAIKSAIAEKLAIPR